MNTDREPKILTSNLSSDDIRYLHQLYIDSTEYDNENNNMWKNYYRYTFEKCLTENDENLLKASGKASLSFVSLRPYVLQLMRNIVDSKASAIFSTTDEESFTDNDYFKNKQIAQILNQKYEKILEMSNYDDVEYNVALQAAVGGKGIFKIVTKYLNDFDFTQSLFIEAVPDPTLVFFDSSAQKSTKLDAEYVFQCTYMDKETFSRSFPDKNFNDIAQQGGEYTTSIGKDGKTLLVVCDCYYKVYKNKKIYLLSDGTVTDEKTEKEVVEERTINDCHVYFVRFTNDTILQKPKNTVFKNLPFVMVEAESYVDNQGCKKLLPTAQHGFDTARSNNFLMNYYINHSLNSPRNTYQIAEEGWTEQLSNSLRNPERGDVQVYKKFSRVDGEIVELPPPIAIPPTPLPQEFLNAAQELSQNLNQIYGVQFPSLDEKELSGKALYNLSQFISTNNEILMQNLYQAISDLAQVVLYALPEVQEPEMIKLEEMQNDSQYFDYIFQPSRYNIVIQRGVSHKLQQEATVEKLLQLGEQSPLFAQFLNSPETITFLLENQDMNNKSTILKLWENFTVQLQQKAQQPPPIDPLTQAKMMDLQASAQEKQAKAQATMVDSQVKTEELQTNQRDTLLKHIHTNNRNKVDIFKEMSENKRAKEDNLLKLAEIQQRNKQNLLTHLGNIYGSKSKKD